MTIKANLMIDYIKYLIDNIREDLKDLSYKLSKSELKEIKRNLYNIEKRKKLAQKKLINI